MSEVKTIGVLTSGGDAPGMNAAIRAVVRAGIGKGMRVLGIRRGYNGLINGDMVEMNLRSVSDIMQKGGTVLYTARCLEFKEKAGVEKAKQTCINMGLDGLVVIGGDGSFRGARDLSLLGIPCVGIPGTIDNDIASSDYTIGYDTCMNTVVQNVDRLRDTSQSHDRCSVVEVMGRHCGDIALKAAAGTGAEICIVPEVEWSLTDVADRLSRLIEVGNPRATVVVAEGAFASMRSYDWKRTLREHGMLVHDDDKISTRFFTRTLRCLTGSEARTTILGYTQRGRQPSAYDSWFAFEAGNLAVNLLRNGIGNQVIGIRDGRVFYLPIQMALKEKREFNRALYDMINEM